MATITVYRGYRIENSMLCLDMVTFEPEEGSEFTSYADDEADAKREIDLLLNPTAVAIAKDSEETMVHEDYCYICGRCTDHRAEHSMQQLVGHRVVAGAWA